MQGLQQVVARAIRRESLIPSDGRVTVALSGGGDSVALASLLLEISKEQAWSVADFLHINHKVRESADEDESFCRSFAEGLGVPIKVVHVDVGARARADRISVEEAGHDLRYETFDKIIEKGSATCVATGHTRNDLAETVLLRLIRGAGPGGLAGIRPRHGIVIRPLLDVSRAALRQFLGEEQLLFREDETNNDIRVTRNRIRHLLLPFLADKFSPSIDEVLAREAAISRSDAELLDNIVDRVSKSIVTYRDDRVELDAKRLSMEPLSISRRIAKRALEFDRRGSIGFDQIDRFLAMAAAQGDGVSQHADFPGSRVSLEGSKIVVKDPLHRGPTFSSRTEFDYELTVPGEVTIWEAGLRVSLKESEVVPALSARGDMVAIQRDGLALPFSVRSWRAGDVVRPLGLGGRKKVQDLFVDQKIPRKQRNLIPIVTDSKGEIVWVVGQTVGDDFRVTDAGRGVLTLKVMQIGDHI